MGVAFQIGALLQNQSGEVTTLWGCAGVRSNVCSSPDDLGLVRNLFAECCIRTAENTWSDR